MQQQMANVVLWIAYDLSVAFYMYVRSIEVKRGVNIEKKIKLPVNGISNGHMWCDQIDFAYIYIFLYFIRRNKVYN